MSQLRRMLSGLPEKTLLRFELKYVPKSRSKAYTYAAVFVRPDQWFMTGDLPAVSTDDLVQMLEVNGRGLIEVHPPRDSDIDSQVWTALGGGDWESGAY